MAVPENTSQQILVEEISNFVDALERKGLDEVLGTLLAYVEQKTSLAPIGDDPELAGTESFLNRVNYFVTRDAAPVEAREPLLRFFLDADVKGKLLDRYHRLRARSQTEIPSVDALERELKRYAAGHMGDLFERYREETPGAAEEFVTLFTGPSFELVKFLFHEAERLFGDPEAQGHDILPELLNRMELRMFDPTVEKAETQAILDRVSYLLARLSIDALRRVDEAARRLRAQNGTEIQLSSEQSESMASYLAYLKEALPGLQSAPTIQDYLKRINESKSVINGWDKKLMIHIDVRLGLKQYHNAITEDLLRRSREAEVDLMEHLRQTPHPEGARIQAELHHAVDQGLPVTHVVERAVAAEQFLRRVRHTDAPAQRLRDEVMAKLRDIEGRLGGALSAFEQQADAIGSLVQEARLVRDSYKALIAEDPDLKREIDHLRTEIVQRLNHAIESLKLPSPNDTNRLPRPVIDEGPEQPSGE